MRISDWSSDVCSSDLHRQPALRRGRADHRAAGLRQHRCPVQVPDARRGDRMSHLDALPPWAAILVAVLVLAGALFAFIGSLGLLRLNNFYQLVPAPTLGTPLGTFLILDA